jgi:glycosyltransferase involved in cell wall biosynthesis
MMGDPRTVILNAAHAHTGGGAAYIRQLWPMLEAASDLNWIVAAPRSLLHELRVPPARSIVAPPQGFVRSHIWEQLVLPIIARRRGAVATLCNANYVPFLAPRPVPILHCAAIEGGRAAQGRAARLYWRLLYWLTWASLARARHALTTAAALVDDYAPARWLKRRGRMAFAPPGAPPIPDVVRDPKLLIAVGDLYPHKGYATLIAAMTRVTKYQPAVRLVVIGREVDKDHARELDELVRAHGVGDRVHFLGGLPHSEALRWLASAALAVSASSAETTSMVAIEAMAAGTPLVARDLPFQRSATDGAAFLVMESARLDLGFAGAILNLLRDDGWRSRLGAAGLERAKAFAWEGTADTVLSTVRQAIGAWHRAKPTIAVERPDSLRGP